MRSLRPKGLARGALAARFARAVLAYDYLRPISRGIAHYATRLIARSPKGSHAGGAGDYARIRPFGPNSANGCPIGRI